MDDVTEDSLVLVDELGKGTEVRAGAAIAAAMLERLDAIGCRGIFATYAADLLLPPSLLLVCMPCPSFVSSPELPISPSSTSHGK